MNTNPSASPLVTGVAVAAVTVAALGAVASTWVARSMGDPPDAVVSMRPAADAAVRVVKAPAEDAVQQSALGTECAASRSLGDSL